MSSLDFHSHSTFSDGTLTPGELVARAAQRGVTTLALLAEFRDLGGAAIEVVSASHRPHHCAAFAAHARQFGLAASAGSDFHSPQESYHDLGSLPALPAGVTPVWTLPKLSLLH